MVLVPYSAKFWRGKTLANRSFQTFGEENVGELTIANNIISYFSESGIWLGKILANDVQFAKFAKVFPRHNFALYGITSHTCGSQARFPIMVILHHSSQYIQHCPVSPLHQPIPLRMLRSRMGFVNL